MLAQTFVTTCYSYLVKVVVSTTGCCSCCCCSGYRQNCHHCPYCCCLCCHCFHFPLLQRTVVVLYQTGLRRIGSLVYEQYKYDRNVLKTPALINSILIFFNSKLAFSNLKLDFANSELDFSNLNTNLSCLF